MLSTSDHPIGCETAGFPLNLELDFAVGDGQRDRARQVQTVAQVSDLIAHDFNNLLQVVKSALHIIERREHGASTELSFVMKQALQSADKAAVITHRLLALSRPPLSNPQPLLCSVAVRAMADRLRVMLGRNIELELLLSNELPPITCDIGQLENAVMNLAIN